MPDVYNEIINSLDIADIIGEKVKLRKTGRGYMGLCPFHNEKTPSFHIFSDTQTYYCFGCHEAGNIFSYVMKTEGLNFREALEVLAERAGIKLQKYERISNNKDPKSKTPNEIVEITAKFFSDNLRNPNGTAARAYLTRRNLDNNDIIRFSLGYSLNSWDSLVNYLRKIGISDKIMLDLGLALEGRKGLYDRFRGRVMFPIKDITGKIIAFGGRLIDGEGAKYINSPETIIYSKRRNLYLLNEARRFIRERKRSILVEGYMDALRLHKCGFTETVASLGTSLTDEQAELLARFADRCYICYDADAAGQTATLRGMYILAEHGLDVRVVSIPNGKDPDEFLSSNPPEKFEEALRNSKPLILQHIDSLQKQLQNSSTRRKALQELFEGLAKLNPDSIIPYKAELSEISYISPSELDRMILSGFKELEDKNYIDASQKNSNKNNKAKYENDVLEQGLCAMLFNYSEFRYKIEPQDIRKILQNPINQNVAVALLTENFENLQELWISSGDSTQFGVIAKGSEFCEKMGNMTPEKKWAKINSDLMINIKRLRNEELHKKMLNHTITLEEISELSNLMNTQ